MRTLNQIDREIAETKAQLKDVQGTPTEIYTRIVGYYRSLKNWNRGKREEYGVRRTFEPDLAAAQAFPQVAVADKTDRTTLSEAVFRAPEGGATPEYLYFFRQDCPNCKPVRTLLTDLEERGEAVDVDTDYGMRLAMEYQILATPTVVFIDADGTESRRATAVQDIREAMTV